MLALLFRQRLRLWLFGLARGKGQRWRVALALLVAIAGVLLLAGVYALSVAAFSAAAASDLAGTRSYLALLLGGMALMALLGGVGAALHHLYLASDLDLLLASPVPLRTLYLLKLAETAVTAAALPALPALVGIAGYGRALQAPPAFYALLLPAVLALVQIIALVSMVSVMLLARFVPARRVQAVVTFFGTLVGVLIWLATQGVSQGRMAALSKRLAPLAGRSSDRAGFLPTGWAAHLLLATVDHDAPAFALNAALLTATTGALLLFAYTLFVRTFYVSSGRVRESGGTGATPTTATQRRRSRDPLALLAAPVRALVLKDWRSIRREPRLISALIFPLVVSVGFSVRLFSGALNSPAHADWLKALWLVVLGAPVILFVMGSTLPPLALGLEGRTIALLRSAPLSARQLILGKLLANLLPVVAFTALVEFTFFLWRGVAGPLFLPALAAIVWLAGGSVLARVAAGALNAKFDADNPRQSVGCLGQALATVVSGAFLVLNAGLLAWLALLSFAANPPAHGLLAVLLTLILLILAFGSVAAVGGVTWLAARRLENWEEG